MFRLAITGLIFITCCFGCGKTQPHTEDSTEGLITLDETQYDRSFEARGKNFEWYFYTPGPDGILMTEDDVLVGNELKVVPQTQIELQLTSEDYIYTLTAPDGTKQIAVPEMVHSLSFESPDSGIYEFRTDPMCGLRYFHDDVQGTMQIAQPLRVSVD